MAEKPEKGSEPQGVFLQTKSALLPLGALTVQNLGKDGDKYWCRVLNSNTPVTDRISGDTEEKALARAAQIIQDVADRIYSSPKNERLVIPL